VKEPSCCLCSKPGEHWARIKWLDFVPGKTLLLSPAAFCEHHAQWTRDTRPESVVWLS
jgi:hypothetical protein